VAALHPTAEVEPHGDDVRLYAPLTGRGVVIAAETLEHLGGLPAVQQRLARLGLLDGADLSGHVVCRHRATHLLPDDGALWCPVPRAHGSGGHAYRAVPLSAADAALYAAINGRRTAEQLAAHVHRDPAEVAATLRRWTARDVQAVQLRPTPPRPGDPGLLRLFGPARQAHPRTADQHAPDGTTTLAAYHLDAIDDGATHFDDRETTVAHALALPHPGLGHRPYGRALREVLGWRGPVVEVGCGTGELAAAWLSAGEVPYLRVDLSPELLATQARAAPATAGVLADATRLPLRDHSVAHLLSNEVLADLAAVPVGAGHPEVVARCARYGLSPRGHANLGAWQLVEEVARVLAPGGQALLTEFGTPDGPDEEATQLDHPEVSIRFADLMQVAEAQGLRAELVRLDELLGVDLQAEQLHRVSWMAVRARAAALGHHLSARAWTQATLRLPFAIEGLHWGTLADEGPGPLITRFWALRLHQPPA